MTVYLYVVRHGEAKATAPTDALRPLTPHGRFEATFTAKWLKHVTSQLSFVFASPYLRAQQTKDVFLEQQFSVENEQTLEGLIPEADPARIVDFILATAQELDGIGRDQHILCVSHMPLVSYIIGELTGDVPIMATAGLAKIKLDVSRWAGELECLLTPEQLMLATNKVS